MGVETQVTPVVCSCAVSSTHCLPVMLYFQMEFAVQMTRESCVDEVKKSLHGRPGESECVKRRPWCCSFYHHVE